MNEEKLTHWLDTQWQQALDAFDSRPDEKVDRFVDSSLVSIRYAILTQLPGKYADPSRDLLCLQKGDQDLPPEAGHWDPRGFCTRVVVPWVQRNYDVLGSSADPCVNNPLRRPRLDEGMESLKNRQEWDALVKFLSELQDTTDQTTTRDAVIRCLKSIARRLKAQQVDYPIPNRIGLYHLCDLLDQYLVVSSGGLRPLIVATALMRTLGQAYSLFPSVDSQGLNEADAASGQPGDVMCYDDKGELALAVEVKGEELTLIELRSTISKARSGHVTNILFMTPEFDPGDREEIQTRITEEFAQGSNLHQTSIRSLAYHAFTLLGERWRVTFLEEIGSELDARSSQPSDRTAFANLLTP